MPVRYFTLEEANAILPELRPLMSKVLERRAKAVRLSQKLGSLLDQYYVDFGGAIATELVLDFEQIDDLLSRIKAYGCVIKNLEAGLVDFLAQKDGRDIYLCWRYGEDHIAYYHELHTGFRGRRTLD